MNLHAIFDITDPRLYMSPQEQELSKKSKFRLKLKKVIYWCIRLISLLNWLLLRSRQFQNTKLRILAYHRICDLPRETDVEYYNVSPDAFTKQMQFLKKNRYNIISIDEFLDCCVESSQFPPMAVIITFDDGFADNYYNAFPILRRYGFCATFFIVSNFVHAEEPFPWLRWDTQMHRHFISKPEDSLPMSHRQLKQMSHSGMTIGSHTKSHRSLNRLDRGDFMDEILGSKNELEQILSKPVEYFSFPFGSWTVSSEIKKAIRDIGYKAAVTVKIGHNQIGVDLYELRRIPIYEYDTLGDFKRKLEGAFDWLSYVQSVWSKLLPFLEDKEHI